jgi:hypothetical protein
MRVCALRLALTILHVSTTFLPRLVLPTAITCAVICINLTAGVEKNFCHLNIFSWGGMALWGTYLIRPKQKLECMARDLLKTKNLDNVVANDRIYADLFIDLEIVSKKEREKRTTRRDHLAHVTTYLAVLRDNFGVCFFLSTLLYPTYISLLRLYIPLSSPHLLWVLHLIFKNQFSSPQKTIRTCSTASKVSASMAFMTGIISSPSTFTVRAHTLSSSNEANTPSSTNASLPTPPALRSSLVLLASPADSLFVRLYLCLFTC